MLFSLHSQISPFSSSSSSSIPHLPKPFKPHHHLLLPRSPFPLRSCPLSCRPFPLLLPTKASIHDHPHQQLQHVEPSKHKHTESFWAAINLIVGTAVGPGMLGLPSATLRSGPLPSSAAILLSWIYVVSSILLVAELSLAAMRDQGLQEVSFTSLAADAFGPSFGALVAVVYACLSFSLLVACVSGIGSLVLQQFPAMNVVIAHALFPCFAGVVIGFFPFAAIDSVNRLLCSLMLVSITALVAVGLSIGRSSLLGSLGYASWRPETILPAIPVTVLTLGFHVITPFVCKLVGDSPSDARKAILLGGSVPLAMVLAWNFVVLGMAGTKGNAFGDPIKLLLSVNSSALPAVQGFAFAALATSLIGYAVSFPKQLADTVKLIAERFQEAKIGGFGEEHVEENSWSSGLVMWSVIVVPVFIASFFPAVFSRALDFAGVYANCFLFGVLPPAMACIHRSRKTSRSPDSKENLLPGGKGVLVILFGIAVILGVCH